MPDATVAAKKIKLGTVCLVALTLKPKQSRLTGHTSSTAVSHQLATSVLNHVLNILKCALSNIYYIINKPNPNLKYEHTTVCVCMKTEVKIWKRKNLIPLYRTYSILLN